MDTWISAAAGLLGALIGGGLVVVNDRIQSGHEARRVLAAETRDAAARLVVAYRLVSRSVATQVSDGAQAIALPPEVEEQIFRCEEELFVLPHGEHLRDSVRELDSAFDALVLAATESSEAFSDARRAMTAAAMRFEAKVRVL